MRGFGKALGLLDGDFYTVHRVGPVAMRGLDVRVNRSAVCYDIENREPSGVFNREIAAFPERINYFTEVAAAPGVDVVHVWRCNGSITDRIRLDADGPRWRTWSRKENLARGTWILTTELGTGAILDTREFHIT